MASHTDNSEQLRAQAAFLISQARAQSMEIERALSSINASMPLYSQLSSAAGQISSVIHQLSQALQSGNLRAADLMALQSVVSSGDVRALIASASAAGSDAARAQIVARQSGWEDGDNQDENSGVAARL
jgi:uncharacterized protein YqfA (UPF0365 family)